MKPTNPQRFSQDLDYTHERLYRTVSGLIVGQGPITNRLACAQLMLVPLFRSDFPRELRDQFTEIVETKPYDEETADRAARSLVELFLDVSERVINPAALGDQFEQAAWCVMEAHEGRPEPLRRLMNDYKKRQQPLPANIVAFRTQRAKGLANARRGRKSLPPARVIGIARMVRDRLAFQKLHHPKTSLNATCKCIAPFIGLGPGTPKAAYLSVYRS